jgi:hypothetical protein
MFLAIRAGQTLLPWPKDNRTEIHVASTPTAHPQPEAESGAPAPADAHLDARYGRTPTTRKRRRIIAIVVAAAFVVVFGAWVVFAAFDGDGAKLETRDLGYTVGSDRRIDVQYTVSVEAGTPVTCAVQAQSDKFAIVGWKVVQLPPAAQFTSSYTTSLATSERAVTGLIYQCWLP